MKSLAKKVAVLMGGWSGEREVSLSSAVGVLKALESLGYDVKAIDVTPDIFKLVQELSYGPDVVFMGALHGRWVEDGCLQGLLEMMNLPYTHSGVRASANAMYKPASRRLLEQSNLPHPQGWLLTREMLPELACSFPCVIKPLDEGSSLGVEIIQNREELLAAKEVWKYGSQALVEVYIPGRELQVGVAFGRPLGVIEICPHEGFYDYKAKYTDGHAKHIMPAPVTPDIYAQAMELAVKAYKALECEGIGRIDLRYNDTPQGPAGLYVLEVNTQPGMTPLSLVPEIAAHVGISFGELVQWMVENPRCPNHMQPARAHVLQGAHKEPTNPQSGVSCP